MELQEAFRKSIKKYFEGMSPSELEGTKDKKMKYSKKYFDKVGKEYDIKPYGEKDDS